MAAKILDFIRKLIRDADSNVALREVTDDEIEESLRSSIVVVNKAKLLKKYDHVRKIFYNEYAHQYLVDGLSEIEDSSGVTQVTYATVVFLRGTTSDAEIAANTYAVDALAGEVYFAIERSEADSTNLYATYSFCNPYDAAASMLENISNEFARFAISAQLSSLKMDYQKISEVLIVAAEHTRARGGLLMGQLNRTDRVNG